MNAQKKWVLIVGLALIATTGFAVNWLKKNQKLGAPGIIVTPIPDSTVVKIALPEKVLNFTSTNVPESDVVLGYLPKDTSFGQRRYDAPDGFSATANVILMGTDRTSIHKADYCLAGSGWDTVKKETVKIHINGPQPYDLPVAKWTVSNVIQQPDGKKIEVHGLYVFWFVAENEMTVDNNQRILWLYRDLLKTGVLQRWAYISYQTMCLPGQEDAAFERLKNLIAASVPEFQLPPKPGEISSVVGR